MIFYRPVDSVFKSLAACQPKCEIAMKRVEIYTKDYCPHCHRANILLQSKNMPFVEYDVTNNPAKEQEMRQRSGRQTVPEIFVDDALVGG